MKQPSQPRSPSSRGTTSGLSLEQATAKALCERDHLFFSRYFFKHRQGIKFLVNWHHQLICDTVQRVIDGELKNVVINVPPGSSKTEVVAINLIARGLALNPRARFLHISYSDDLALLNSQTARDIVQSDEYQALWPMAIAADAKSKKRWNVVQDGKKVGGVYAVSLGGQITGFRAGHMAPGFQGAIIIDDPLKVGGAYSKPQRDKANRDLVATVNSRKANPDTPIIVIMQRLSEEDPTGFIKSGQMPGEWEFVEIPALISDEYVEVLPEKYRAAIDSSERDEAGRFSYWPYKEPLAKQLELEKKDPYVHAGQYMQKPSPLGGGLIQSAKFGRYTVLPELQYRAIFVDTAQKTAERNDYSVFECWGRGKDGRAYLIDVLRGKWTAPVLKQKAIDFWNKHQSISSELNSQLLKMWVEDKSSGTGLIQDIQAAGHIPIEGIPREKDKLTRVMDILSFIESGLVFIPADAHWVSDFTQECDAFTPDDTHMFDDQIDPMVDAINDMLAGGRHLNIWAKLGAS